MPKKPSLKRAKARAWAACSLYVRWRDARGGYCTCYTCGVSKPVADMQAGHAIQGRGNSILFETDGIRPQCAGCNVFQNGRLDAYIPKLMDDIGRRRYDELLSLKWQTKKFTVDELLDMEQHFIELADKARAKNES